MDKVHFMGPRSDVPELLASWDAFLYSTDHDTFGIAVVEAIAAGLPTFVNDWEVMKLQITANWRTSTKPRTQKTCCAYSMISCRTGPHTSKKPKRMQR